jgi:hypothetical protein
MSAQSTQSTQSTQSERSHYTHPLHPMSFTPGQSNSNEIAPFELLQASFSQAIPIFLPLIILASPTVVVQVLLTAMPSLQMPLSFINTFFLTPFIAGASVYFVYRYLSSQTSDLGGAISQAVEKIINLVLGFFLYLVAVIIGVVLFIIPGLYVAVRLGFVLYAVMIDDLDAVAALKASWSLVEGRWLTVFAAQLLPAFCFLVPLLVVSFMVGVILGPKAVIVASLIGGLIGLVATPFLNVYYTKLYLRLRGSEV